MDDIELRLRKIEARLENLEVVEVPGLYTAYTPTWTASISGTSVGNGTLSGRYFQVGSMCHTAVQLDIGSSTNKGFGVWEFTLPITPSANNSRFPVGPGFALDAGVGDYACICRLDRTTGLVRVLTTDRTTSVACSSNVPFTWGNGDTLTWSLSYEV